MDFLKALFASWFPAKPQTPITNSANVESTAFFTGVLPDNRTDAEKALDYLHEEREITRASDPFANKKTLKSPYPYENQQGTSSCVSHGVGLAFAILRASVVGSYTRLGWLFHYRRRSNYPGEGYVIAEGFYNYKQGAPLYATAPDVATENEANKLVITQQMNDEASIFEGVEYYMIGARDIYTLANIAQGGTAVAISIFATYQEWAQAYPQVYVAGLTVSDPRAVVNHEICILPESGFVENGTRYVAVQDSAWFGGLQLRYLSEDFIAKRVTTAGYWTKAGILGGGLPPKFVFTRTLSVGTTGADVKALQRLLISEHLLPSDCVTGLFAGRTLAAVRAFQMKYESEILSPIGLTAPTNTFGTQSIKKANKLCA